MNLLKSFLIAIISYIFSINNHSLCQPFNNSDKYNGVFSELFFGRQPSARAEALGRSFVSILGDANSYYYNPAGLASLEGLNVSGTYANPYYLAEDAKYIYLSASYKIKKYGVISFSHDYFKLADLVVTNELGEKIREETLSLRNYRLSLASEIISDLFIGVNFNLFRGYELSSFSVGNENTNEKNVLYVDLGIIKSLNFQSKTLKHTLNFGSSIINLNSAKHSYVDEQQTSKLPVIFRIGASYNLLIDDKKLVSNLKTYNLLFITEYQKLFNSDYYDGLKTGFELTLLELLSIRTGYYHQDINEVNCGNCENSLNKFTFGIGVNIPLRKFSDTNIPLEIKFDYAGFEQPSHVTDRKNWDDFHVYNLKLNWIF